MATDPLEDLVTASKDVVHIGVGIAVLAFQKAQVQRRSIERAFASAPVESRGRLRACLRRVTSSN